MRLSGEWGELPVLPPSLSMPATPLDSGDPGTHLQQHARGARLSHQGA